MRQATEVIVSYSGDAADYTTVSLKFSHVDGSTSTVRLLNDVKSHPRYEDGIHALREIVDTGLVWAEEDDDSAVHVLWDAVVPIR
jgi:hypothetical protein